MAGTFVRRTAYGKIIDFEQVGGQWRLCEFDTEDQVKHYENVTRNGAKRMGLPYRL